MKKFLASFLMMLLFVAVSNSSYAQQYFVYDGDTFSVMLKCSSDNSKVLEVSFSANNKWNKFEIVDFSDLEDTDEGGFLYTVKDGKGTEYTIDYYRTYDYIKVNGGGGSWKLYRRDE